MGLLRLNNKDFQEFLFDMNALRGAFERREAEFQTDFGLSNANKIGDYHLKTRQQGGIYLTQAQCYFHQHILAKSTNGINNIALFFVKRGRMFNYGLKEKQSVASNTHNVLFMHEDYSSAGEYFKEQAIESESLHLPVEYFAHLATLYPEMFEAPFLRYQKGESFYLRDSYRPTDAMIYSVLFQLEHSYMMGDCSRAYTDAKVLELLSILFHPVSCKCCYKYCKTSQERDKIYEAAHILLSDIHSPPSIRELSLEVGVNEKKLKYGFKEVFGTTVYGYLFDHKMNLAKRWLLDSNKNISEIAELCGYEYSSHFCTAFKRKFGVSPLKKREQL